MNIIVVDDETIIRSIFEEYFQDKGHYVKTINKYENLSACDHIDLYILDYEIKGGMSGYDWLQKINEEQVPPHKRLMMSGTNSWFKHNLDGHYLLKPFNIQTLDNLLLEIEKKKLGIKNERIQ